ncbi:MAG: hypothetical protein KIT62_01410 [Cyclobacteriaceae bacterium]|nr:hypothetical protein [Cyclobacteriaceae bacterium]
MTRNILIIAVAFSLTLFACNSKGSKADNDFDVSVASPELKEQKPKVLFDKAHKNHHKIETTYKPFATLISNDGCIVNSTGKPIDQALLSGTDIFIIATAMGKKDPGDKPPFSQSEIEQLEQWVTNGGSLLLVTEHFPFGLAMKPVFDRIGVQVHNGYTEDTLLTNKEGVADALLFTKANGSLNATHPILDNVERLNTFTGSSVKGDSTWTPLLIFTPDAQNYNVKVEVTEKGGDIITNVSYADFYSANGYAQGICKQYGKGKIVVLAESAFLTAQFDRNGNKFGMNLPNQDNKQFVLNLIRWLAKK